MVKPVRCGVIDVQAARTMKLRTLAELQLGGIVGTRWTPTGPVSISLVDYVSNPNEYRRYSALLRGVPLLGKTPAARSIVWAWSCTAVVAKGSDVSTAIAFESNSIEGLRLYKDLLSSDSAILLDESELHDRSQYPFMSVSIAKLFLDPSSAATLRARKHNVFLPANTPRLFTANSPSFAHWCGMEDAAPDNVHLTALCKRCYDFQIVAPLFAAGSQSSWTAPEFPEERATAARIGELWRASR